MKKIPCLFVREFHGDGKFTLTDKITPGCEWVQNPNLPARPYRKWDGTAAMIKDEKIYKRYDCKKGKIPPAGFEPCQEPDKITGHWPGWVLCSNEKPEDKYFIEAFEKFKSETSIVSEGTCELVGPKINGNPEKLTEHKLVWHAGDLLEGLPPEDWTFEGIKSFLSKTKIEGIVFHSDLADENMPMAKIRRKDFGFEWPISDKGEE